MNYSKTEPMWVKFAEASEFVFVGKDVIATAFGIYVHFFNLKSRFERIEQFDSEDRGDGATCLAGHPVVPVLSVAEAKSNPSINLFAYPSMRRIACCPSDGKTNAYLHCTFAGSDYLISQTTFPDFRLIVWKWRSGERIAQIASKITEIDRQVILCSSNSHAIGKFSRITGELEVYRLLVCSRNVRLCPIEISRIPKHKLVSVCWSSEAKLYACDEEGSIYCLDFDAGDCARVITVCHATSTGESPVITSYRTGILLASVDANVRSRVTFVRKSTEIGGDDWQIIWTVPLPCHPRWMSCQANGDAIILRGDDNQMILVTPPIKDRPSRIDVLYNHGRRYIDLCATSIDDRHLGILDNNSQFSVLDVFTGNPISPKLNLVHHGTVLGMESHRSLPLVATCSNEGNCLLIDMNLPVSPKIMKCFHLQGEVLNRLKFSKCGSILGVSGSEVPRLFLISGNRFKTDRGIRVIGFIRLETQVADFLIYESDQPDTFGILILASSAPTENNAVFSRRILVYSCKVSNEFHASPLRSIELPSPFKSLYYAGEGKPEEIIAIAYLSKLLYRIQMRDDGKDFVLEEVLPSLHRTKNIHVNTLTSLSYIVTCGDDGFIVVRDEKEPRMVLAIFTSHHRLYSGVNRVTIVNDTVVSLGKNGDLVANRLSDLDKREKRFEENCLFSRWTTVISSAGLVDEGSLVEDETWIDRVIRKSKEAERDKTLCTRLSIISDFQDLSEKVRALLDSNEKESTDSRVPVSDFDLDKEAREGKIARAKLERQRMEKQIEGTIARQDRATSYLQERFLKPLAVRPLAISSIVGECKVANYPLHLNVPEDAEVSASHLLSMKEFFCQYINDVRINENEDVKEVEQSVTGWMEDPSMKITANLFSPPRGYLRTLKLNSVIEDCERKAKCQFNDVFNEVRQLKKARIEKIELRISRLRECVSELRQTYEAEVRHGESHVSADWNQEEIDEYEKCLEELERILQRNREKCQSAVSQASFESNRSSVQSSEQTSLDQVSEVPSKEKFVDDALDKMMDGVLEVRWEDEVKKDVAKPDCLQKDPSKYTEDDLKLISDYNNKVKNLRIERQRYKSMLESEFARATEKIGSSIHDFGKELEDLGKKRIQAERATLRYTLTRIRMIASCLNIARQNHEISSVTNEELIPATKESRRLAEECDLFESAIIELKNKFESLAKKEKQQEAKFRSEFPGLKQPMVEQLFRHYGRRPKIGSISCTSLTFLTELASCVINNCTSEILPRECLDYLRGLDCLDLAPDGLPAQIDSNHWRNMCRLRRAKVETEIKTRLSEMPKVKSCAVELTESEYTLSFLRKTNNTTKNRIIRLKEKLRDLERVLSEYKKDSEIGIVLKAKQVEIQLSGDPSDTANAVLVRQEEVIQGNNAIVNAGEKKLATLGYSIDLQKEVLREEWRHACMKARMNDLREYLEDLRGTKITRIVLECSRQLGTSLASRVEPEKIEENLKELRERLKRKLEEEKCRLDEVKNQIELWRERNSGLTSLIENYESECKSMLANCKETHRLRETGFRRRNLQAISKELILSQRIQENREELLTLSAHLEICKLRTYPTLRFK